MKTEKKNKPLELRFTGEESLKVSRNFMRFIDLMYNDDLSDASELKLHVLAYVGYQLRESVALFSRFQISEADIKSCLSAHSCIIVHVPSFWM